MCTALQQYCNWYKLNQLYRFKGLYQTTNSTVIKGIYIPSILIEEREQKRSLIWGFSWDSTRLKYGCQILRTEFLDTLTLIALSCLTGKCNTVWAEKAVSCNPAVIRENCLTGFYHQNKKCLYWNTSIGKNMQFRNFHT